MTTRRLNLLGSFRTLSRDLRLLFLSLFLWTFGLGLWNYVWPIYLRELQASPEQVGLVFSVGFLAAALSMVPGGILANKFELRKLLIISWAASLPPPITFYLARTWVEVVPGLVILQLSAFSVPALNAYISAAGNREKMSSAFGTVFSAAPLGIVFSPAVGSVLLNWLRIRDLFLISFLFFTLSTLVLFPIRRQPPLQQDTNSPKLELPRSKHEAVILVLLTGIAVAYSITSPFLPLYSQDILRLNDSQVQLLGATQSLGTAFFAVSLGRLAVSRSKGGTMAMGLSLAAIGVLTIPLANSPIFIFPMVFLFGAERAPALIAYSVLSSFRQGASRAGRFGVYLTLEQLGFVAGSYLGGPLYVLQPALGLYLTAMSFAGLAVLGFLGIRKAPPGQNALASKTQEVSPARTSGG